jgi:pyruvate dehydrogenase E1 component alpha subunit
MGGKVRRTGATTIISEDKLKHLYASMLQCRMLTEYAQSLPKRNTSARLYKGSMGQEAIACGCVIDLRPEDTIVLAPHDSIAHLVKGVPLGELLAQLHARPSNSDPETKLSMATQAGLAHKRKKKGNVVMVFADKATSTLDSWRQSMEIAAKGKLPILYVVENNPWPRPKRAQASGHQSCSFPVFTVDANDVVAVYRVAYECLERVRRDGGPVLVQAEPYRLEEVRDPLLHMERYLKARKLFSARWKKQLAQQFSREVASYLRASRAFVSEV